MGLWCTCIVQQATHRRLLSCDGFTSCLFFVCFVFQHYLDTSVSCHPQQNHHTRVASKLGFFGARRHFFGDFLCGSSKFPFSFLLIDFFEERKRLLRLEERSMEVGIDFIDFNC